jgi:quercetin dioxygenase-like cupin family protein
VEVYRFGPGFRRTQRPTGAHGLAEQTIWSDARARITELAFAPQAVLPPQSSPQHGLFIVVSGGGWVQVGDERTALNHGEAVEWPPLVAHGAWTDGSHMRAILVEVPDEPVQARLWQAEQPVVRASDAAEPRAGSRAAPSPARGSRAERPGRPEGHDPAEGEPW